MSRTTLDIHEPRDHAGSPTVSVRGVTKRFGPLTAVEDLSFDVRPGVVTGFLGENGAGKSTTLRILLGLASPSEGSATVLGVPYAALSDPARSVGAVLETQSYNPMRTGRNHLVALAAAAGVPTARVDEVLEQIGMTAAARRRAGTYSLGMRQRLAIGAALLGDPRVLVLDEPANGLDPKGIRWLRDLVRGFVAGGRTVLVSSHALAEMEQLADQAIVISRGRLVRHASLAELTNRSRSVRVRSPRSRHLADVLRADGHEVVVGTDGELRVTGAEVDRVGALAFDANVPVYELTEQQASLEDVFFELTREER
jgi:ABC-2 type transport system ATP-binding protein